MTTDVLKQCWADIIFQRSVPEIWTATDNLFKMSDKMKAQSYNG